MARFVGEVIGHIHREVLDINGLVNSDKLSLDILNLEGQK